MTISSKGIRCQEQCANIVCFFASHNWFIQISAKLQSKSIIYGLYGLTAVYTDYMSVLGKKR